MDRMRLGGQTMIEFERECAREHSNSILTGLARQCPKCGLIAHYSVKGRKPVIIMCVECDHEFAVQKYKRGERPHD